MKIEGRNLSRLSKKQQEINKISSTRLGRNVLCLLNEKELSFNEIVDLFNRKEDKRKVREILFLINSNQSYIEDFIGK